MSRLKQENKCSIATLAGGCFWCTESVFSHVKGVAKVVSGYTGGETDSPTYEQVCSGRTSHAEVVQITFDSETVSFRELLEIFFATHDPTTLNRQGNDVGTQYRSVIFYHDEEQKHRAEELIKELNESGAFANPIVTILEPITVFFEAEEYHQQYFERNPNQAYCQAVIPPKLAKLRKGFAEKLKTPS